MGKFDHAVAVIFRQRILDCGNRIGFDPAAKKIDETCRGKGAFLERQPIALIMPEFGGRYVERNNHILARRLASGLDSGGQGFERLFVAAEERPPSSLIRDAGDSALARHDVASCEIDLAGDLHYLFKGRGARDHHHEILNIDPAPGMRAAAKDLYLGQRE